MSLDLTSWSDGTRKERVYFGNLNVEEGAHVVVASQGWRKAPPGRGHLTALRKTQP